MDTLWTDYIKLLTKTTGGQHQGQSRGQPDNLLGFALDDVRMVLARELGSGMGDVQVDLASISRNEFE